MKTKWIVQRRRCSKCKKTAVWCYPATATAWPCPDCETATKATRQPQEEGT